MAIASGMSCSTRPPGISWHLGGRATIGRFPGDAERWGCHSLQRSWKEHGMHLQHSWCKTASTEDELVLTLTWAAMLIRASLLMSHCNRLGKMTTTCVAPLTVCAPSPRGVPAHHRNDRLCHVVPQYVKILVHRTRLWLSGMRLQPCPCLTSRSRCAQAGPWHESRWACYHAMHWRVLRSRLFPPGRSVVGVLIHLTHTVASCG